MDKLTNLTGFCSKNKNFNIDQAKSELERKKKTYSSVNLSKLPDKGAKLKKQIDELEDLLQTLTLENVSDNEIACGGVSSVSKVSKKEKLKKNLCGDGKQESSTKKKNSSSSNDSTDDDDDSNGEYDGSTDDDDSNGEYDGSTDDDDSNDEYDGSTDDDDETKCKKLPFSKAIGDPINYPSFSDYTPKDKGKNVKTDLMNSPSFKSWRQTEVKKTLLTEAKPLLEKPNLKSTLKNQSSSNPVFQASKESVKKIHNSLSTYPDEFTEESEPDNLRSKLMLHQKRGLAWMMWREEQDPRGGVLADDMGLGKTLSIIALILKQKERKAFCARRDSDYETRGTLIVCSASIIHQWEEEIIKHCEIDAFKVYLYHGPKRDKDVKKMKSNDIVLTTYNLVQSEKKKMDNEKVLSPLFSLKWERIVLDEAHTIKNDASQTAQAIFSLKSFRKWAVTGTPIHNVFKDFYALVKFLQFSPFDDKRKFKALTESADSEERRKLLIKSILLRRTKDEVDEWGKPLIEMKNKTLLVQYIDLSEEERKTYDIIDDKVKNKFDRFLQKASHFSSILVLLLRLQQCCNHLSLLKKDLELCSDPADVADALSSLTITEDSLSSSRDSGLDLTFSSLDDEKLVDIAYKSTKISALFKELHKISKSSGNKDKSVIVSQWTSMLDIIAFHLKQENIKYHVIAGNTKVEDRQTVAHDFNNNEDGPKIMLLSLKAGGVGLNLIGANHLFLMDIHWNPALETQACDRIHRVGQKKDVFIHKFICKGTIEEKINQLQNSKRTIASNALSGTKRVTSGLTIEDYKMLFGIL